MNPEQLLHETAKQLRAEAIRGPGMMFVMYLDGSFNVTRTPKPEDVKLIIAKYDCMKFCDGLTPMQWTSLLRKLAAVYVPPKERGIGEQQPAKKP